MPFGWREDDLSLFNFYERHSSTRLTRQSAKEIFYKINRDGYITQEPIIDDAPVTVTTHYQTSEYDRLILNTIRQWDYPQIPDYILQGYVSLLRKLATKPFTKERLNNVL